LPSSDIRSKVRTIPAFSRQAVDQGETETSILNSKLKKLVQQLGEAIHETVSESEHIAGVVQDIRKQGFDVLLMLEATIGLNELEQQPEAVMEPSNASDQQLEGEHKAFSSQDVHFLRSLRIAIQGDERVD